MAAKDKTTVYLPKMPVRPGQRHSYQSTSDVKVVAVDPAKTRADAKASNRKAVVSSGGDDE